MIMRRVICLTLPLIISSSSSSSSQEEENDVVVANRIRQAKLDLWLHGAFSMTTEYGVVDSSTSDSSSSSAIIAADLEMQVSTALVRHGPIRDIRRRLLRDLQLDKMDSGGGVYSTMTTTIMGMRGGDGSVREDYASRLENQLAELSVKFGKPFIDAIERVSIILLHLYFVYRFFNYIASSLSTNISYQNQVEHAADCARSCELFYCANDSTSIEWDPEAHNETTFASYSFGSVPPEDFSDEFQYVPVIAFLLSSSLFSCSSHSYFSLSIDFH
jgi:hypothetical protein